MPVPGGSGDFVTHLVIVRLTDWSRRKYHYPDEHILAVDPSGVRDAVTVLVRGSGVRNEGVRRFLEVSAEDGKILREAPASYGDEVEDPFDALPALPGASSAASL